MRIKTFQTSGAVGFFESRARNPKVSIMFDSSMLAAINARVRANGTSFAQEVRTLVATGLACEEIGLKRMEAAE